MATLALRPPINPEDRHYIAGYTGFQPRYRYRLGDSYGHTNHQYVLEPALNEPERLVLSDRTLDDFQVVRECNRDIDVVISRYREFDPIYRHPWTPGYEAFIPRLKGRYGQFLMTSAVDGLVSQQFRQGLIDRGSILALRNRTAQIDDYKIIPARERIPIAIIRPEKMGVVRDLKIEEPPMPPPRCAPNPFFETCHWSHASDDVDEDAEDVYKPYTFPPFSNGRCEMSKMAMVDFVDDFHHRRSTQWAPQQVTSAPATAGQIYLKDRGMINDYAGHIPGARFRVGKTFGNDSRDAKRWIRGDFIN